LSLESNLIDSLFEGLLILDDRGHVRKINPSAERILGKSRKSVMGMPVQGLFPGNTGVAELVETSLAEGRTLVRSGIEYTFPGRSPLNLFVSVSCLQKPDGSIDGAVLLIRDETLLKEVDRSHRRADQLSSMDILNLGMAHEIRNPLGGIKGSAQLLSSEIKQESPLQEYCEVILREVNRIDSLIESLLAANPKGDIHTEEINIHEVLNEALALVKMSDKGREMTFSKVYDPSLPSITAERNGLFQVFLNLFKNAVEASPPRGEIIIRTLTPVGGPLSHLLASEKKYKGGLLEVDVMDQGHGFDPVITEFGTPFFTTKSKGVGLGLAICERIIRNHGGSLSLDNREEGGAKVRIFLPMNPRKP